MFDIMKGKYYESDYEEALIDLLVQQGWEYTHGGSISRNNREVLFVDDLMLYLQQRYPDLQHGDIEEIINRLRHVSGQTHFELLRNTYYLVRDGFRYIRNQDGETFDIEFVDFEAQNKNNIYRCVNQFEVGYGQKMTFAYPMCYSSSMVFRFVSSNLKIQQTSMQLLQMHTTKYIFDTKETYHIFCDMLHSLVSATPQ